MRNEDAPSITLDTTLQRNDDIFSTDVDGEVVMMSIERGSYFGANKMGSRIWELLEQPTLVSGLCEQLMEEFDVDPDRCRTDVLAYMEHLSEHELVEIVAA